MPNRLSITDDGCTYKGNGMSFQQALSTLLYRPLQRKTEDLQHLASFVRGQPFFSGVDFAPLLEICRQLTLHRAAPGEEVLHRGELTDRLYLLLSGSCRVVRHSRREGFQPLPPQLLHPGQALCEASLELFGRKSDVQVVAVTAAEVTAGAGAETGGSEAAGGGAVFAVLTRAAWSSMCVRAPMQSVCGQARLAMLCCCARSLASCDPAHRTLEQAEDLAALLRMLPCMSIIPEPILRAMSEAAYLRRLPAGTILFEECTRAEAQFLVLSGSVRICCRRKRLGGGGPRGLGPSHTSTRRNRVGGPSGAAGVVEGAKSVREMIAEERKAREALKESLVLTREGLREPRAPPPPPPALASHVSTSRKWMSEFVDRARKVSPGAGDGVAAPLPSTPMAAAGSGAAAAAPAATPWGNLSSAAKAWRRAVLRVTSNREASEAASAAYGEGAGDEAVEDADESLLREYERLKREEAGEITDLGYLLGGAGSRDAYYRGLQEAKGGGYGYTYFGDHEEEQSHDNSPETITVPEAAATAADADLRGAPPATRSNSRVRLLYLDTQYHAVSWVVRFPEAAERVERVLESRYRNDGSGAAEPSVLYCATDAEADADTGNDADAVVDAGDEHLAQLYGTDIGLVEAGHMAGELPDAALGRVVGLVGSGTAAVTSRVRIQRTDTAVTGPSGSDVLVVALETLRRGHDAARDDLVSERLAMLTALEPLRGLSDEHQAQLALGCAVLAVESNHVVVRQGQTVDALYVVLDGEVRLLDDSLEAVAAATAAATPMPPPGIAPPSPLPSRSVSLNGATFSRKQQGARDCSPAGPGGIAGDGSVHGAIRARRGLASLPALTLLGPGGSFGESVLGYPEDFMAAAAVAGTGSAAQSDSGRSSDDDGDDDSDADSADGDGSGGDTIGSGPGFALGYNAAFNAQRPMFASGSGDGGSGSAWSMRGTRSGDASVVTATDKPPRPAPVFLASAVASRPTKLLVLSRSLLFKYGYLRTSLPPFAELRREAINGRRQQLRAALQALPAIGMGMALDVPQTASSAVLNATLGSKPLDPASAAAASPTWGHGGGAVVGVGLRAGAGGGGEGALHRSPSMPSPRPPPPRTIELLEHMGFKKLSNPRTTAILSNLTAASTASATTSGGSGNNTPERRHGVLAVPTSVTTVIAGGAASTAGTSSGSHSPVARPMSPGTPTPVGPGDGTGSGAQIPISTGERARRVLLLGGPEWPSRPLSAGRPHPLSRSAPPTQEVNDDIPAKDGPSTPALLPPGPAGPDASSYPGHAAPAASSAGATTTAEAADWLPSLDGVAGHSGGSRAPPMPTILRTSLSGARGFQYNKVVFGPRVSCSGLSSLGGPASHGFDSIGGAGGCSHGASLTRHSSFHPPLLLRTDSLGCGDNGASAADGAASPAGRRTLPSSSPNSSGTSHLAAATVISAAAAATTGGLSGGLPTRGSAPLPVLHPGRSGSPMARMLPGEGNPGSGAPSPRVSSSGVPLHAGGGGIGVGQRLIPSTSMRASYNGSGPSSHHFVPLTADPPSHRGSAPGSMQPAPLPPPPQQQQISSQQPLAISAAQLTASSWSGLGASRRSRLRAGQPFGAVTVAAAAWPGGCGTATAAPAVAVTSRRREQIEPRFSWDGIAQRPAVQVQKGGGGGWGGQGLTALAIAALAAGAATEEQHCLV